MAHLENVHTTVADCLPDLKLVEIHFEKALVKKQFNIDCLRIVQTKSCATTVGKTASNLSLAVVPFFSFCTLSLCFDGEP